MNIRLKTHIYFNTNVQRAQIQRSRVGALQHYRLWLQLLLKKVHEQCEAQCARKSHTRDFYLRRLRTRLEDVLKIQQAQN